MKNIDFLDFAKLNRSNKIDFIGFFLFRLTMLPLKYFQPNWCTVNESLFNTGGCLSTVVLKVNFYFKTF